MMNREHGAEWQARFTSPDRYQSRGPVVSMQDLRRRCQSPREFEGGLAKEDKTLRIVLVGYAVFAVDPGTIKEFIAAHIKQLHASRGATGQELSDISLSPDSDVDGNASVLAQDLIVLTNLLI